LPADILLYAVIAAGLVFWLRSLLGTRQGDEPQRPNPFTAPPASKAPGAQAGPAAKTGLLAGNDESDNLVTMTQNLGRNMAVDGAKAELGLLEIMRADRSFDLAYFLTGAQDAFILIVESFAAGDRDTLQGLLAAPLYQAFEKVITEREEKGEQASMEIHAVRKAEVIDAVLKDGSAYITVRFVADETALVRDEDGRLLSGDPDRVTETTDIWTFGRALRSRDPAWLVYETREAEADEKKAE